MPDQATQVFRGPDEVTHLEGVQVPGAQVLPQVWGEWAETPQWIIASLNLQVDSRKVTLATLSWILQNKGGTFLC